MTLLEMLQFLVLIIVHHLNHNRKNNFFVLGEGPAFGINGSFGAPEKRLILISLKRTQNFV